jgi:hypothetical protein
MRKLDRRQSNQATWQAKLVAGATSLTCCFAPRLSRMLQDRSYDTSISQLHPSEARNKIHVLPIVYQWQFRKSAPPRFSKKRVKLKERDTQQGALGFGTGAIAA